MYIIDIYLLLIETEIEWHYSVSIYHFFDSFFVIHLKIDETFPYD